MHGVHALGASIVVGADQIDGLLHDAGASGHYAAACAPLRFIGTTVGGPALDQTDDVIGPTLQRGGFFSAVGVTDYKCPQRLPWCR